jgi:hypothetical protein
MNRQERRNIAGSMSELVGRITGEKTWEDRWNWFAATMKEWLRLGQRHGFDQKEIVEELGGELARRIVNHFDSPPICGMHQALFYQLSNDSVHRIAAEGWQLMHPEELQVFSAQYPGVELLREPAEEETGGYLLNLRGTALLILESDEQSPPVIALRRLMHTLAGYYRTGWLTGSLEEDVVPHDARRLQIEVLAAFLCQRLKPANAEAELAVADLFEQTEREADKGLRMLYLLAGRPYRTAEI